MLKISALKELQYMLMPLNRYFNDNTFWIHRAMKKREQKNQHKYDTFLVLDFEATCEKDKKIEPQEIIEFPCIKVNAETCEIEDIFHQYVQPKQHPILTTFCTDLTGITQEMIHNQPHFEDVFLNFQNWLVESGAWNSNTKSVFVTCGDWDLKVMLPHQCEQLEIDIPHRMTHWINIKKNLLLSILELNMKIHALGLICVLSEVTKLCSLVLTIPAKSASAERLFLALKQIHTYQWNTQIQSRFSGLSLMAIGKELLRNLKMLSTFSDSVIDKFARKDHQLNLLYKWPISSTALQVHYSF